MRGIAVIGQRLPVNLAVYLFLLFAVGYVKGSQRPVGVNVATDVSAQLPATLTSTYGVTFDHCFRQVILIQSP